MTALLLLLCLPHLSAIHIYVVNSVSRTLSRIDTDTDQVQNAFATLGVIPNRVIVDENWLWCVNSGDNGLQKINRQTGQTAANILCEAGCNAWDAVLQDGFLYVTGLFTNKVYKVNAATHSVEGSLTVGTAPEGLCVYNGKLYVTNTGGYQNNYAGSSVSVINLASFCLETTLPVQANPQYITAYDGLIYVSCTGNWTDVTGRVCVINPLTNAVIQTLNIGGSLGGIWIDSSGTGLVGDGNGTALYRFEAESFNLLNGSANPLSPGGSMVDGNAQLVAVLAPNWSGNGSVHILHPDLSIWKTYQVGMIPTDLKLGQTVTPTSDETCSPVTAAIAFPNPCKIGTSVHFNLAKNEIGHLSLYNTKGQLLLETSLTSEQPLLDTTLLKGRIARGICLYNLQTKAGLRSGKLVFLP